MITGKSKNLQHLSDDILDAIDDGIDAACDKCGEPARKALASMSCVHCGSALRCRCESWRGESVTFSGLYCSKCGRRHGWTGFRMFRLDGSEITGFWRLACLVVDLIME